MIFERLQQISHEKLGTCLNGKNHSIWIDYRDEEKQKERSGKECMKCGERIPENKWQEYIKECQSLYTN